MIKLNKRIGIGSLSLVLCIAGMLLAITYKNGVCIGDNILNFIGLKAWSNGTSGTHYTIFYSLILFIPSILIGHKFKKHIGAKLGKVLSIIMITILTLAVISAFAI